MKIIINGNIFDISDEVVLSFLSLLSSFISHNPFHIKELENVDLANDKSLIPFFNTIHDFVIQKYQGQSTPRRVIIQGFVRSHLVNIEKVVGMIARPGKRVDAVIHGTNMIMNELIPQVEKIEKEVLPHAIIEITTSANVITGFCFRTDTDQRGRAMAPDGDTGVGKDDSGETHRPSIDASVSGDTTLHT